MKKGLATMLTLMMLLGSHPIRAFAAEQTGTVKISTSGANTNRNYDANEDYAVMSVEIEWENTHFTYHFGDTWDAENHCYLPAEGQTIGWDKNTTSVSVKNHSNMEIDVDVVFEKSDSEVFRSVSATFDKTTAHLESAVGKSLEDTPTATFTLTIDGIPDMVSYDYASIGTITVYVGGVVADVMSVNLD